MPKLGSRLTMLGSYLALFQLFIIFNSMPGIENPPVSTRHACARAGARALRVDRFSWMSMYDGYL
jgi:hypothetical protein